MANTGIEIVLTLKEVIPPCPVPCTPTGNTKPNMEGDPDYIAPYLNTTKCPITYSDDCPATIILTPRSTSIEFEFSLNNDVVNNPNIASIKVSVMSGPTNVVNTTFTLPNTPSPNWFHTTLSGLTPATPYGLLVEYYNASSVLVKSCPLVNFNTP